MNRSTIILEQVLSGMHAVQHSAAERLMQEHPRARMLTARDNAMRGLIEQGESMLVEPCDRFDDDGVYVISVTPEITVVRRLRLLCGTAQVSVEAADGRAAELFSLEDALTRIDVVGRVVASCAIRRH